MARMIDAVQVLHNINLHHRPTPVSEFESGFNNGLNQAMWEITHAPTLNPVTREQVEKVWRGCDLCLDDSWQRNLMIPKRFDHISMLSAELAQFCPGCGRPLTDEAVDMVMERMEEVQNDQ